jgi:hypothetical protein
MSQVAIERANADDLLSAKLSQEADSRATDANFWRLESTSDGVGLLEGGFECR